MNQQISGSRIRRLLERLVPEHRITVSEAQRLVRVEPDSVQEAASLVTMAAREGLSVIPQASQATWPELDGWAIQLSLSRLSAITDYSESSGLVCVQCGADIDSLTEWLLEKGRTLAVSSESLEPMELWEFLLSPGTGRYGPRFGMKWDQVFSMTAVLPNGKLFKNSLAPARATGPDFTRLILLGQGRFGLPLEVYVKLKSVPARRLFLTLAITDLRAALDSVWRVATEVSPEYMELALNQEPVIEDLPRHFVFVELWGEGKYLSLRKELVRKHFGSSVELVDFPYEVLVGMEKTLTFRPESTVQMLLHRDVLYPEVIELIEVKKCSPARIRVKGFIKNHACLRVSCDVGHCCGWVAQRKRDSWRATDSDALMTQVAEALDPVGVFRNVPLLWRD